MMSSAEVDRVTAGTTGVRPLVLHVPFTYFPDAAGGTEVYVASLAKHLAALGYACAVAAPADHNSSTVIDGIPVHRFAITAPQGLAHAYGRPDETAAASFADLVGRLRPAVVHLHARTAAVSERLIDIGHAAGARVVFTYHTPTVSCGRGTMLLFGREPCDGVIERRRCMTCTLEARGAPRHLAALLAAMPPALASRLAAADGLPPACSALRTPGLMAEAQDRFRGMMRKADRIVAVSDWVAAVLRANGVAPAQITVSRQGVADDGWSPPARPPVRSAGPVRIAYFGRLDPTKGVDLLIDAVTRLPEVDIAVDLFLVRQQGSARDMARIEALAGSDRRITVRDAVPAERVRDAMASYDLIAVPSRWLETGPLVVLEAFSAGVPVLGARRGGIAEIVRDDIDGILFEPDDAGALAAALKAVAVSPTECDRLRKGIRKPRSMRDAAADMAGLYGELLAGRSADATLGAA